MQIHNAYEKALVKLSSSLQSTDSLSNQSMPFTVIDAGAFLPLIIEN